LNRASSAADVYSHVPYQGRVEVKVKKPCRSLSVRAPEWIESGSPRMKATRAGNPVPLVWDGRYVRTLESINTGDVIVFSFPIELRTVRATIADTDYTLEIRGNTVVSISPGGENGPLYRREYMKADRAPTVKVSRFIAQQSLIW
jgi:hypothetical protein